MRDIYLELEQEITWEPGFAKAIQCPDDWYEPIKQCWEQIKQIDPTVQVCQIKSKFGGLRFYVTNTDLEDAETCANVDRVIRNAEKAVYAIEASRLER